MAFVYDCINQQTQKRALMSSDSKLKAFFANGNSSISKEVGNILKTKKQGGGRFSFTFQGYDIERRETNVLY